MNKEIWKDIPTYEGLYQVSNLGRVKSLRFGKEKILAPSPTDKTGHLMVVLHKNGKRKCAKVHQLVMFAFTGERPEGKVVMHLDSNPQNNELSNLRWGTNVENSIEAARQGKIGRQKLKAKDVEEIRALLEQGASTKDIAEKYGITDRNVRYIRNEHTFQWAGQNCGKSAETKIKNP